MLKEDKEVIIILKIMQRPLVIQSWGINSIARFCLLQRIHIRITL